LVRTRSSWAARTGSKLKATLEKAKTENTAAIRFMPASAFGTPCAKDSRFWFFALNRSQGARRGV
jgi:hypothetical protein